VHGVRGDGEFDVEKGALIVANVPQDGRTIA
jgi:hypothetical protein